jgi:hypothetical protein
MKRMMKVAVVDNEIFHSYQLTQHFIIQHFSGKVGSVCRQKYQIIFLFFLFLFKLYYEILDFQHIY